MPLLELAKIITFSLDDAVPVVITILLPLEKPLGKSVRLVIP